VTEVTWDYTNLAKHYDNRADYPNKIVISTIQAMSLAPNISVADIGAGTGKLSRPLAHAGLSVLAVEPNDAMRSFGIKNTEGMNVRWNNGRGEDTQLGDTSVQAVFFGSSFNVVDQHATLMECRRIVQSMGWFACLWNHRNLSDALQSNIEEIIRSFIPEYNYGSRREDPTDVLQKSGLFSAITPLSEDFMVDIPRDAILDAWRSHGTLARQAGSRFGLIIDAIDKALPATEMVKVPYTTRLWYARFAQ